MKLSNIILAATLFSGAAVHASTSKTTCGRQAAGSFNQVRDGRVVDAVMGTTQGKQAPKNQNATGSSATS